jgi:hypothetical protein
MRTLIALVILAVALPAWSQAPKAPPEQKKEPATKPAEPAAKPAAMAKKSRRNEDARHCLEQPSNAAIIKCAEAYL